MGLYFARFWKSTGDRFFLLFALSFWIEGAHRLMLWHWAAADEATPIAYLPRLLAYALIIVTVIDKNRDTRKNRDPAQASGLDKAPGRP